MEKKQLVLIDGELEYILHEKLTDKGLLVELRYSKSQCWADHIRDTKALEVIDDGNGIKILTKLDKNIDYHKALMLVIVINKLTSRGLNIEIINYIEDAD
jgi:hypothetical protein